MAANELTETFKKAQSAADSGETARCVDALKAMRALTVSTAILQSTQVGKHLRKLAKNTQPEIRSVASDILDDWKKLISMEAKKAAKGKVEAASSPRSGVTTATTPNGSANSNAHGNSNGKANGGNGNTNGVAKLRSLPKCNDPARDKVRELLLDAFSKVPQEAGPDFTNGNDPVKVAVDVETTLYSKLGTTKTDKKGKYRSIIFNLKDANNPDFRRRVLSGEIKPVEMTTMSAEEMASDQRKAENKQIKDKAMFECERGMKQEATTNEFKCGKCGKRECTYYQKQIRSADEPMTTFVTCVNCNNRWKFC